MTDKEKIREEVEKLKSQLLRGACASQIAMETRCKEEAYNEVLAILDSLQEEPIYTDFTKALAECIHQAQGNVIDPMVLAETWKDELIKLAKSEEPVSGELEEASKEWLRQQLNKSYANYGEAKMMELTHFDGYAMLDAIEFGAEWQKTKDESTTEDLGDYINELSKQFPDVSFAKLSRIAVRVAKWQKSNLWKPADGDDLPEIDREVIVLINYNAQLNIHDEEYPTYRVGFGHRPNPDGWDGKNIDTNEITHYTPKLYDKGGWNAPNIVYWLDVELPKEIKL